MYRKIFKFNEKYIVFKLPTNWQPNVVNFANLTYSRINEEIIDKYFFNESRYKKFKKFIQLNYLGYLMHNDINWINYIWSSTPLSPPPIHLPRSIAKNNIYWIFYCNTNELFRNKGFYSLCLNYFCNELINNYRVAIGNILIDTENNNIPAIKAIKKAGFIYNGNLRLTKIVIPKIAIIKWGKWIY